jgi:hypothetical protein
VPCYRSILEASKAIEDTFSLFVAEKARWILVKDPFGVIYCLITPLIRLAAGGLSRIIPALLDTLELLVRKIIRLDLPSNLSLAVDWVSRIVLNWIDS